MKRIILTAIIVISSCPGCHAESNNKTVENHAITTNQIVNTAQPKINLNCQGFELDHDDYLLCDSWQKSNQLNKNISLKNFNKYHKINNRHCTIRRSRRKESRRQNSNRTILRCREHTHKVIFRIIILWPRSNAF